MAEPVEFEGQNFVWKKSGADVDDLPVFRDAVCHENISCWQLNPTEIAEVVRTGKVWLHVWGNHPPVFVGGEYPFVWEPYNDEPIRPNVPRAGSNEPPTPPDA